MPPSSDRSLFEKFEALHSDLAALVEQMGEQVYCAIEDETLKLVAIAAGVDHTREGTAVLQDIGAVLQRERDVNRELRRQLRHAPSVAEAVQAERAKWEGHALIDGEVYEVHRFGGQEVVVHHAPGFSDDGTASIGDTRWHSHTPIPPEVGINGHVGTWTTVHPVAYLVAIGDTDE